MYYFEELNVSHHWRHFLPLQIKFIQAGFPGAEFVVTTNVKNSGAGKSDRLDKVVMPQLQEQGIVDLLYADIELFYTQQNVWKINLDILEDKKHLLGD